MHMTETRVLSEHLQSGTGFGAFSHQGLIRRLQLCPGVPGPVWSARDA